MSINDKIANEFLSELASNDVESIIDNPLKFKSKLDLGEDAYTYLKNIKNLSKITIGGTAGAGLAFGIWSSSLGFVSGFGVLIGLVAPPVGLIAAASVVGAAGVIGVSKIFKKIENKTHYVIPKFITSPLDILGISIASILVPLGIKMAYSNYAFSNQERDYIYSYFTEQWGYNSGFIYTQVKIAETHVHDIDYKNINKTIKIACKNNKDLNYRHIKTEIIKFANEIINVDNVKDPKKMAELKKIKKKF